ncbi:hypothetical protein STEG23_008188, partial [Scotinomys teguina]
WKPLCPYPNGSQLNCYCQPQRLNKPLVPGPHHAFYTFLLLEIKGVFPRLAKSSMALNSQRSKTDFYLLNARIK